ncbi:uncharacterized protein A4U43_C05F24580 [Asparagus officinalis]|uniref:Replication protein A C-terminal domain-containing protein n=1 Tax=Asparagus officinalis TaxID=4686 RepID=A0A5P1EYN4_ASPOF|nr:uncharacterized protein A4U43_C05F24580 [Asparagus officinalis]
MGSRPMVLGVVVDKVGRATDVSFLLDDGTGKIEINRWISVSVPSDSVEVAAVENGMYVLVHGHVKEFQGRRHAFAFSIRPVIDFNDISLHFIECVCVHLENTRLKGGAPTRIQMNPVINLTLANGTNGYQTPLSNQFPQNSGMGASKNDICSVVLGIFQEPSILAREHGLHIDEVFRSLGVPKNMILEAINYLVDVGHIYSTIDEYHFKSASSGHQ